ncbi:MAG: peroxiredoxin [Proteobacteria bacterium]|nr:peroxiredoxin [Pseudomonadota bacterium]
MTISVGDQIPAATLRLKNEDGIQEVKTDEFFKGKRVALFAVPGAFTPTCSAKHLPGFVDNADALKGKGIDSIACVSVNDPFVMGAWAEAQNVGDKVAMLADGNGEFAKALGLEMDGSGFGLGKRSHRYSMVVNDGKVEILNVEPAGSFGESSAEALLGQL